MKPDKTIYKNTAILNIQTKIWNSRIYWGSTKRIFYYETPLMTALKVNSKFMQNVWVYESFGISKRFPIKRCDVY